MSYTVAIIGRPNVGKSTLFNRLVGKRLAIVDDLPGVTRDRREGEGRLGPLKFTVIDTAGLDDADDGSLEARMQEQTEQALDDADLALMLVDARAGLTPLDEHFSRWLRRRDCPVLLLANKCEGQTGEAGYTEAYSLGLGEPLPVSAAHGDGLGLLASALAERIPEDDPAAADGSEKQLQLAILGRPNAGKSTLVNRMVGEDRMLTGPEAGITRDAIGIDWVWRDQPIRLIDTAGMRRKSRVKQKLERLSTADGLRAMEYAHVVVLLVDAMAPLEKQDLTLARIAVEEGRALVVAANKWDLVLNPQETAHLIRERVEEGMAQVRGVPIVTLSALTGRGIDKLMPAVVDVYEKWQTRIPTGELNRWLAGMTQHHPPPLGAHGRRIRLRYMTQAKARPPTFIVFANLPDDLPEAYVRFLQNGLRDDFGLNGIPLRIQLRKQDNPYASR